MSAIAQAVDGLLAGLLLPATRLLWIHGLFKMVVEGLAPVCRLAGQLRGNGSRNRIRCAGPKQAGIVLILKSGDKGKYWKGGALCGDRVATKLPTIAESTERCVAGLCVAGKERKSRGQCDRRR
jgi:hypothetical protein